MFAAVSAEVVPGVAVYRVALVAGVGALLALVAVGLVQSVRRDRSLPPLTLDYGTYVWSEFQEGRRAAALDQLELAVAIDLESHARLLPALASVARVQGESDVERTALERFTRFSPEAAHVRLAELALDDGAGAGAEALAEAERHAEAALAAKPDSIPALIVSGRIARARGDTDRAFDTWNRAGSIDPRAAQRALTPLFNADPELGYDFIVYRLNLEGS